MQSIGLPGDNVSDKQDAAMDFGVSRETSERLGCYFQLLEKWNARINLVSRQSLSEFWSRHALDSLQAFRLAHATTGSWADLGSGGGFPGLVMAIVAAEQAPDIHFTLVESDKRKATFLSTVNREIGLNARVIDERIEVTEPLAADVVSARALAPLPRLLGFAHRHLAPSGQAIFLKGAQAEREVAEALESWRFTVQKTPSCTDASGTILSVGDIARV